jgi:hypothetical protein
MERKSPYPEWVNKCRKPGTEIRKMKDKYYVYEVSSFYDKEKKRARKKTGKYLGAITENGGFKEATSIKVPKSSVAVNISRLSTKEYGMVAFIQEYCGKMVEGLKTHFPGKWQFILVALYCRLLYASPMKNMAYYFKRSFFSEEFDITVNAKNISDLLKETGKDRKPITDYMYQQARGDKFFLIDATSIVSYSKNLSHVENGLAKDKTFAPLFNLLYFYSPHSYLPAYYRIFSGNIKDVKMACLAIQESLYKDAIIIGDKGFYSEENLDIFEDAALKYIIPLKRNSNLIRGGLYEDLTKGTIHFLFEERVVYYTSYPLTPTRTVHLFTDELMMANEKKDFIFRMKKHPHEYTNDKFKEHLPSFGTLSLITNETEKSETVYLNYKSRAGIEILFDGAKNILGNDHTYMQNDEALEGWMFINHLALQAHHKIYSFLKSKNLLYKYSIRDFIEYLSGVRKVRINEKWILEPMIAEQQKMLKEIGIHIP